MISVSIDCRRLPMGCSTVPHSSSFSHALRLLIDGFVMLRMRKRAVQKGWGSLATGSNDPIKDADVCMPMTMPEGKVESFRKVAEAFKNPMDMMKIMISSTVSKAREPAAAEDSPAAVGASFAGSENDGEEDEDARKWFPDRWGKGKTRVSSMSQTLSARGSNTATPG